MLEQLSALLQVVLVDLVLAGDNAVAVGLAAAGLAAADRNRVILIGIAFAALLRIVFAVATVWLLAIPGIVLFGGLLLLWVAYSLGLELWRHRSPDTAAYSASADKPKTMRQAIAQIVVADVSMSLDNVLAVAGIARDHVAIMVFGLALAVVLMGVAAAGIARLLQRHFWIGYVGVALIVYVALQMIIEGGAQLLA